MQVAWPFCAVSSWGQGAAQGLLSPSLPVLDNPALLRGGPRQSPPCCRPEGKTS